MVAMRFLVSLALVMLAACSTSDDTSAGGVTQGESDALNNAAAMLDKQKPAPPLSQDAPKKAN